MCFKLIKVPIGLVLPFAGWLAVHKTHKWLNWRTQYANVLHGHRNKVLVFSIVTMWISAMLPTLTFVVERFVSFTNYLQIVLLASLEVGYGCFQANIIQFGIDQLTNSSTDEIVSFINWYIIVVEH